MIDKYSKSRRLRPMFWWGEILLLLKMYLGMARFSDCWGEKLSQQNWNGAINVVCWTNVDFSEELYIKQKNGLRWHQTQKQQRRLVVQKPSKTVKKAIYLLPLTSILQGVSLLFVKCIITKVSFKVSHHEHWQMDWRTTQIFLTAVENDFIFIYF